MKPHLLFLCGPTASGKTSAAISLARRWKTEILSADSVQIYRGLNIGSAKPSAEELAQAKHHLIDFVDPRAAYSVAAYQADFQTCLREHFSSQEQTLSGTSKIPIVCGGTGLYFNALLYDYDYAGAFGDSSVRLRLMEQAEREGRESIYERLCSVDPDTAKKLSPNDVKRVVRALEIFEMTGRRKSELAPKLTQSFSFTTIGLQIDRELLYKRIDNRVLCMFKQGLVEEVEGLLHDGVDETCQSMQAIGYKETVCYLHGRQTLEDTIAEIQKASRNYAKRQVTWFKRMPNIRWLEALEEGLADRIEACYLEDEAAFNQGDGGRAALSGPAR